MNISFAWTTDALLAGRKKVTRRDWSREYAVRFRYLSVHNAYNRQARFGGKKVGNIRISRNPYPERSCDIPDGDYEFEGFAYMEENGLLIRGITPREFFENWRRSREVLFVVRFDLILRCDRCDKWTAAGTFGPYDDKRLRANCWSDWDFYAENRAVQCRASSASWEEVYEAFLKTEKKVFIP